jgi:hypothetical protein
LPETEIRPAVDAQRLAWPLIRDHHDHLKTARILWLTTNAKRKRGDKTVLATSSRMSVIQRFLSGGMEAIEDGYDFLILISATQWRSLTAAQQLALVDHQLCRCGLRQTVNRRTGATTETWCALSPDVEEFSAVIRRHGLWLTAQRNFAEAIPRQMHLDDTITPKAEDDAEHERRNAETVDRLEHQVAAAPDTNGVDHEHEQPPGWQEQTGIGSSEIEQQRRRRRVKAEV